MQMTPEELAECEEISRVIKCKHIEQMRMDKTSKLYKITHRNHSAGSSNGKR